MPWPKPASRAQQRIILYSALAFLVILLLVLTRYFQRPTALDRDQEWTEIDYQKLPEVDLLRRYVRIDTTPTTGSELAGAKFLANELRALGLEPHVEQLGKTGANAWAVLEGKDPRALVLHSHIDVYPIQQPEAWNYDPFGAEIDQAWVYGRGVFDMKSLAIVQLLTLRDIVDSGKKPDKSIIFLATGSEEVGSEMGTRWILERHPELASRIWAVLTEGGVVEPTTRTDIQHWGIEFAQKQFANGYLCADSVKRLEAIREQILNWGREQAFLQITPEVETFVSAYAPTRVDLNYRDALENPRQRLLRPLAFDGLPAYLRTLFRNEIVAFPPEVDPNGGARMRLVVHLLPGQDIDTVRARLLPPWLIHGAALTLGPALGADHGSHITHPVFKSLVRAVSKRYPKAPVGPHFISWSATDARFFRQAGIPAYGFSPFVIFSTDSFRVDGPNERISLPGFMTGFDLYRDAVERMVR